MKKTPGRWESPGAPSTLGVAVRTGQPKRRGVPTDMTPGKRVLEAVTASAKRKHDDKRMAIQAQIEALTTALTVAKKLAKNEATKLSPITGAERRLGVMLDAVEQKQREKLENDLIELQARHVVRYGGANLTTLSAWLDQLRKLVPQDRIADKKAGAAITELRRTFRRGDKLVDSLTGRTKRGASPLKRAYVHLFAADAVFDLIGRGVQRNKAIDAVTKSVKPLLPRGKSLTSKTLDDWMSMEGFFDPVPEEASAT